MFYGRMEGACGEEKIKDVSKSERNCEWMWLRLQVVGWAFESSFKPFTIVTGSKEESFDWSGRLGMLRTDVWMVKTSLRFGLIIFLMIRSLQGV